MQPRPEDRLTKDAPPRFRTGSLVLGIAVLVAIALVIFYSEDTQPPVEPVQPEAAMPEPVAPAQALPVTPDIPEPEVNVPEELPVEPAAPELTLDNSDDPFRSALAVAGVADKLAKPLQKNDLVQRSASFIDAMSHGAVLLKVLPLPPIEGDFSVEKSGEQIVVNPAAYHRFDHYTALIARLNPDALATTFHQFRPLLEQAYAALGHPPEQLDNALIAALDQVLATPELSHPAQIKKVEAVYQYSDPELEALPDLQKQLLRAGPENAAEIKRQAHALRRILLRGN